MFEYSIMAYPMEIKPGVSTQSGNQVAEDLTKGVGLVLGEVQEAMETHPAGPGWEIVSYQLTRIDRHLIATFLLRREKRGT